MAVIGLFSFFAVLFFILMAIIPPLRRKISPNFTLKKSLLFGLIAFIILVVAFSVDSDDATTTTAGSDKSVVEVESESTTSPTDISTKEAAVKDEPTTTPKPTVKPTPEPTPEPTEKETASQRNAVRTAKNYLEFTAFSRKGLIEQLAFEGYDTADAEYAVDRVDADWNEQAALKAKEYLEFSSFSEQGLIEQLEFEGFTNAQAKHGVSIAYK